LRASPRWSVGTQLAGLPAPIAALPCLSACVGVGPPLYLRGASFEFAKLRSPVPNAHWAPSSTLPPSDVMGPEQLWSFL